MYKDVKTGGKKKSNPAARKYAVEVINPGASEDLEEGSVILVRTELTIGRREDNLIVLSEPFASGYHANTHYFTSIYCSSILILKKNKKNNNP